MLLVAVGLTGARPDQQVTEEVPAWEAVDSTVVVAEEGHVAAVADAEDNRTVEEET
jgi:hypothetical protein